MPTTAKGMPGPNQEPRTITRSPTHAGDRDPGILEPPSSASYEALVGRWIISRVAGTQTSAVN